MPSAGYAYADAYGAGFEYAEEMIVNNDLSRYVEHPRFRLIPGSYTDDTQMSIAIAEVIVAQLLNAMREKVIPETSTIFC